MVWRRMMRIFLVLLISFSTDLQSASDSVNVRVTAVNLKELQNIEALTYVSDSVFLFSDESGIIYRWDQRGGHISNVYESDEFVDKIFGNDGSIIFSTQEVVYQIDYNGI